MRIGVVGSGGTISSRHTPRGVMAELSTSELLDSFGVRRKWAGTELVPIDIGTRPSFALGLEDMRDIASFALAQIEAGMDAVIVLHGTDSMEETSFLIDLMHGGSVPVVFTGAQRPSDAPDSDGRDNVLRAINAAATTSMRNRGVLVAFGSKLWRARGLRKVHTTDLDAFRNTVSGPVEPVNDDPARSTLDGLREALGDGPLPRVDVVACVPGDDGRAIRAAADMGTDAIVLQTLGIGNLSPQCADIVADTIDRGIPVVVSTRVLAGAVRPIYGSGGGADLERTGAIFAGAISPWQIRILIAAAFRVTPSDPMGVVSRWLAATGSQ